MCYRCYGRKFKEDINYFVKDTDHGHAKISSEWMNLRKPLYGRNESTEDHGLHVRLLVVVVHEVLEGFRGTFLDFRDRLLRLGNLDGICDWDGSVWVAREEAARDRVEAHIKPLFQGESAYCNGGSGRPHQRPTDKLSLLAHNSCRGANAHRRAGEPRRGQINVSRQLRQEVICSKTGGKGIHVTHARRI